MSESVVRSVLVRCIEKQRGRVEMICCEDVITTYLKSLSAVRATLRLLLVSFSSPFDQTIQMQRKSTTQR